ncbi:hypothetical protein BKA70DRAFT_1263018 [Coprinopsis sp. MPI-PUGE-AT-0042]|nr:hypothetical protein BKA70DRAFT_1263018 [Coprinopsis sp. MPI-PUGE-AT-0042]
MPEVLGFNLSVEMEGNALPEYGTEVAADPAGLPSVTCWIPSETGKTFGINIVAPPSPRQTNWVFFPALDGLRSNGHVLSKDKPSNLRIEEIYFNNAYRTVKFAPIQVTDDESALDKADSQLGEIMIRIFSYEDLVSVEGLDPQEARKQVPGGLIHEKTKKALAHHIVYGEERRSVHSSHSKLTGAELQATVIFKYRNLDILVAQEIAPRSALPATARSSATASSSSDPNKTTASNSSNPKKRKSSEFGGALEIDDDGDDDDDDSELEEEEEKALRARLAAIEAKKQRKHGAKRVKAEVKSEFVPSFVSGETIDLTEDD